MPQTVLQYGYAGQRELEYFGETFKRRPAKLKANRYVPTQNGLQFGIKKETVIYEDSTGTAAIGLTGTDDIPFVNVSYAEESEPTYQVKVGVQYTLEEMDTTEVLASKGLSKGSDLIKRKLDAAQKVLDEQVSLYTFYGYAPLKIKGLLSDGTVHQENSTVNPYDTGLTAAEKHNFLIDAIVFLIQENTGLNDLGADTVLIPLNYIKSLATSFFSGVGGPSAVSVLNQIKATLKDLDINTELIIMNELRQSMLQKFAGYSANTETIIAYRRSPENIYRRQSIRQMLPWHLMPNESRQCTIRQALTGIVNPDTSGMIYFNYPTI